MIKLFTKKFKIVTHDNSFHADDIFACATLSLLLKDKIKIIRTRDEKIIKKGDYVVDVGGIYDPETNRFDHHQPEGAGERENGIPYASFGLVWKKFGKDICNSQKVADMIDKKLVQPIDAEDTGVDISKPVFEEVFPYNMGTLISSFRPNWQEDTSPNEIFPRVVRLAKEILLSEIKRTKASFQAREVIINAYNKALDKRIVIIEEPVNRFDVIDTLISFPEPFFGIYYNKVKDNWSVVGVNKTLRSFRIRKTFPQAWSGLRDKELVSVTGVEDAIFCHRGLFLTIAKSREGALALAKKAL